jgi:geranylgeranyl diphosphate synthase type II
MHAFNDLSALFETHFQQRHFPAAPASLYDASQYILQIGGKRVRPVSVLMCNELFGAITVDAYHAATAVELFHNFTLIHDDIMDKAPIRRGVKTVHTAFGDSTALLAGDVMLVVAYEYLNRVDPSRLHSMLTLFSQTAREVCEGQQLDMDFEKEAVVKLDDYIHMITLKTSVLLAASMQLGAIAGGAGKENQRHLYAFGKQLGIAFQIQDDYLDAFGDPEKFGKQVGGDILANKKTFLWIHAIEAANDEQRAILLDTTQESGVNKVKKVLSVYKACGVDAWAQSLKESYYQQAMKSLEAVAVPNARKKELERLAQYLLSRDQ